MKNQQTGSPLVIGLIIVIVLLLGGILVMNQNNKDDEESEVANTTAQETENTQEKEPVEQLEPGELEAEITLMAVSDYVGDGTATRDYRDGVFTHTVVANIGDPAEGKFYEGWLVSDDGLISTGKMEKDGDVYTLGYVAEFDYTSYNDVFITEETEADGLDGIPEAHVLEGTF